MNTNTEKKPAKTRLFAQLDSQAEDENPASASAMPEFTVKSALPPRSPQELLDKVAAQHGFDSRQPARQPKVPTVAAAPTVQATKKPRRQRVVRTEQLNLRVTESTLSRFYALVDNLQIPMGELLDRLLNEYERNNASPKTSNKS